MIGEMSFAVWLLLVATGRRAAPTAPVDQASENSMASVGQPA